MQTLKETVVLSNLKKKRVSHKLHVAIHVKLYKALGINTMTHHHELPCGRGPDVTGK